MVSLHVVMIAVVCHFDISSRCSLAYYARPSFIILETNMAGNVTGRSLSIYSADSVSSRVPYSFVESFKSVEQDCKEHSWSNMSSQLV